MDSTLPNSTIKEDQETKLQQIRNDYSKLDKVSGCSPSELHQAGGWFLPGDSYVGAMTCKELFKTRPNDIILATTPKSGTTWLKALIFATVTRRSASATGVHYSDPDHPLTNRNPHDCISCLELQLFAEQEQIPDLDSLPDPRLFQTHLPFSADLLPSFITQSTPCRIVYLCRNPKDTFVSMWHFSNSQLLEPLPLEAAADDFCNGVSFYGPFWDHVLGYWKASLDRPEKVLFMKYEELMSDPAAEVRRLAAFLGCPFSQDEVKSGGVEGIVRLCGFKNLSSFEFNKSRVIPDGNGTTTNLRFFRKGKVGDWVNHLTPEMARRFDQITESKFAVYDGLTL